MCVEVFHAALLRTGTEKAGKKGCEKVVWGQGGADNAWPCRKRSV